MAPVSTTEKGQHAMPEIFVDLQGLSRVHRTLNTIRHDLDGFDSGYARSQSPAMGHHRVIGAFEDFVSGWSDGRERVSEQIQTACAKIEGAVEAYSTAEDSITDTANNMRGGLQ